MAKAYYLKLCSQVYIDWVWHLIEVQCIVLLDVKVVGMTYWFKCFANVLLAAVKYSIVYTSALCIHVYVCIYIIVHMFALLYNFLLERFAIGIWQVLY